MLRNGIIRAFKNCKSLIPHPIALSLSLLAGSLLLTSCESPPAANANQAQPAQAAHNEAPAQPTQEIKTSPSEASSAPAASPTPAPTAVPPAAAAGAFAPIRIKAGDGDSFTDSAGNVWQTDRGFDGGQTVARPDIEIANTKDPQIYRSERYLMDSFSWPVPNGNYIVKLHFAETFEGITAPGERVFSFAVQGREFNDFDVWKKAGGPLRAYVETVPVTVTNGLLKIIFTPKVENPQINGIEILPTS